MEKIESENFEIPNTHYKNMKTEVIDNKTQITKIDNIDYSKINCSTKDLLKEKDKKIEILQEQMLQLQKKLEQQKSNNYKNYISNNSNSANNINIVSSNCNTSTNFPLKNEIKKIWEELALVSLLDNFIDFEKQPEIIFHLVSEMVLITDKLISELCMDMYKKVSQSLNIINDKKFINDIEKTSRPLIKEHLNKTFAGTNNQQFVDKFINLFNNSTKKIFSESEETMQRIGEVVGGPDFKLMIKKIKDILLFTKFNDQQLFFKIEKDFSKRIVERIKIKTNIEKKKYLIINDNNKEPVDAVILLKPPVLRSGFTLNNDFRTILILYEKDSNSKSYNNLNSLTKNTHINMNESKKGKTNKIVGLQIKKILPNSKVINNNVQIKTEEYNNFTRNKNKNNKNNKKAIYNEEIINTVFSKEQRNSYQKISKNIDICKTQFNINKGNMNLNEENILINDDENDNDNMNYKNINDKRNITSNKKHRHQLSDQILKNNSSKNLFDYIHKDLVPNNSSIKTTYNNNNKYNTNSNNNNMKKISNMNNNNIDINNDSFNKNQHNFISYNNTEINNIISINNNRNESIENDDDDENENENKIKNEILFHNNTAKGVPAVYNFSENYKLKNININEFNIDESNTKNKKERNTHNGNKDNLNELYFNEPEINLNFNQLKEKIYPKNSLTKLNKKKNSKKMYNNDDMNMNDNANNIKENKNYKKINNSIKRINNNNNNNNYMNNINNYRKMEYYNKFNNNLDMNNNDMIDSNDNKSDIVSKNLSQQQKIENIFNQNKNQRFSNNNNNTRNTNTNNNMSEQELILFKKHKTAKLICNKIKNNFKNPKKEFKIIPLIKMKTQLNQANNKQNQSQRQSQNQNIKSLSKIKKNNNKNQQEYNSNSNSNSNTISNNNKMINLNNFNNINDNYRKIFRNNINNIIIDNNNNNIENFNSKKIISLENNSNSNNNTNNNTNANINVKEGEINKEKKILLSHSKYSDNKSLNKTINREKKLRKDFNYKGFRNNNLLDGNFNDYNDINNTGYKIKNVNINYFNIMQPNKLYINQNSTRSKSRPSDSEREKILFNVNNYNKNILDTENRNNNNNIKNVNFNIINNFNNNILFDKLNNMNMNSNNKKILSQENSNRTNNNNNINNYQRNNNNINNYNYKVNLLKNNNNSENYNINKSPLSIITDLNNIEKITDHIKNEKRVLINIKSHKHNNASGLKEDIYQSESSDKNYINNKEEKNSLTIGDLNQSSNNTSRKKNKCQIMNNKHFSYVKIPKKLQSNEVRSISGGIRYIEKNENNYKHNTEYANQINNLNNNEVNAIRGSYAMIEKERNSNKNIFNSKENKLNLNVDNNLATFNGIFNKNNFFLNEMNNYEYNSFRKK